MELELYLSFPAKDRIIINMTLSSHKYTYNANKYFTFHITPMQLHEVDKMNPILATQILELRLVVHRTGKH